MRALLSAAMPPVKKTRKGAATKRKAEEAKEQEKDEKKERQERHKAQKDLHGWMKYRAQQSATETLTEEQKNDNAARAKASEIYESLPAAKRSEFVNRWKATTNKKNDKWMKDFEEEMSKARQFDQTNTSGVLTRLAILIYKRVLKRASSSHLLCIIFSLHRTKSPAHRPSKASHCSVEWH